MPDQLFAGLPGFNSQNRRFHGGGRHLGSRYPGYQRGFFSRGGCLRRKFSYKRLDGDTTDLKRTLALPVDRFLEFEGIVRGTYHAQLHNWIGGTMESAMTSSNAPEMVFHHAFLDKIWLQWQNKGEDFKNAYFLTSHDKLIPSKYYSWEWLDSNNLPGQVKVIYED